MGNTLVQLKVILLPLQGSHAFDGLNLAKRVVEGKLLDPLLHIHTRKYIAVNLLLIEPKKFQV